MVRAQLLREMGLSVVWRLRSKRQAEAELQAGEQATVSRSEAQPDVDPGVPAAYSQQLTVAGNAPGSADLQIEQSHTSADVVPTAVNAERLASLDWDALESEIKACRACHLCEQREQAVPGHGDRNARWLFVGEGPGAEEDRQGLPFVGAAGQLLDAMLESIGLNRYEQVFIANAVKCRPPMNRTPSAEEIAVCRPYLQRQIELIKPKVIVALGRPAAQTLLDTEIRIGAARGKPFHYRDIPVVVTYHPAYLLRNQHDKRKVWEDLLFARQVMGADEIPSVTGSH